MMEQGIPTWLNHSFLTSTLQSGEDFSRKVTIISFSCSPAVTAGNNYLSQVYRVQVEYRFESSNPQTKSFIVKSPITKGAMVELTAGTGFFAVEPRIYNEVLPVLNTKCERVFAPKAFHCDLKDGLVLEDMREFGYMVCNKFQQLDFAHCKSVISLVAQYHAASVVLHSENPQLIEALGTERIYVEGKSFSEGYKQWLELGVRTVGDILSETEEFKPLGEYVLGRLNNVGQSILNICKPKSKGLNVLNHGDLWTNNILFRYNEPWDVIEVRLIDFQIPRYCSPVVDLIFFMWTSANEEVRENRLQELFDIYVQKLNATLTQLGYEKLLTLDELRSDLESSLDWGIVTICCELPFILCDPPNAINLEDLEIEDVHNSSTFNLLFNSKLYRSVLPQVVANYKNWSSYM